MLDELFLTPPEHPRLQPNDRVTNLRYGIFHGWGLSKEGEMHLNWYSERGMVFWCECADFQKRLMPCSVDQLNVLNALFAGGMVPSEEGDEPGRRYHAKYLEVLESAGVLSFEWDKAELYPKIAAWWRRKPSTSEFTERLKARFSQISMEHPEPAPSIGNQQIYDVKRFTKLKDEKPQVRLALLVATGKLSQGFDTKELLGFALSKGWLNDSGWDEAFRLGLLANNTGQPLPEKTVTADEPPKKKQSLAEKIGVSDWNEIEICVSGLGIKYRRAGTNDDFLSIQWGHIDLKKDGVLHGLLLCIAKHNGTYPNIEKKDKRRAQVLKLNRAFRGAFGLPGNPFFNKGKMGTQCLFTISGGRK